MSDVHDAEVFREGWEAGYKAGLHYALSVLDETMKEWNERNDSRRRPGSA